jgi:nuclear transport factor 2 (NTF2) superfamily protein
MHHRHASINEHPIKPDERKLLWDTSGPRPADHPGLTALGF